MTSSIAAIHVAKKQLALDDDTYRAKLLRITGKTSTKDMSEDERQRVLTVLRNDGFQPAAASRRHNGRRKLSGKFAKKLQALWIAGYNLGVFRERDDSAMESFIFRQTKIESERWLHHWDDARAVIEALKKWLTREAGVDWTSTKRTQEYMLKDGYKIARAQWSIISPKAPNDFWPVVTDILGRPTLFRDPSDLDWISVMNHFGEQIRREDKQKGVS